jgi:hypothetical protein
MPRSRLPRIHFTPERTRAHRGIACRGIKLAAVSMRGRRIFENLELPLESAGSSLDRLVQVHAMIYDWIEYDVLNPL